MRFVRLCMGYAYRWLIKPVLFLFDAETIHDATARFGAVAGKSSMVRRALRFDHPMLEQDIDGMHVANPIGLAAGFDYDGLLAGVMPNIGFGFHTVGTVTARPYAGNVRPRLGRLPKSRSLLVNKGFKSQGADAVARRLDHARLAHAIMGISVGSSNVPEVDTIEKAIDDYAYTFRAFAKKPYVRYFELNISCPNVAMHESFVDAENFEALARRVQSLNVAQPIYVKMPNEMSWEHARRLIDIALQYGMKGFIFANLVKNRNNPAFNADEINACAAYPGNFSGKPTESNANELLAHAYRHCGDRATLIGLGGVFSSYDAYEKIKNGAHLVQLITGMIYQGPQLIGSINEDIVDMARRDGYARVGDAVGADSEKHI